MSDIADRMLFGLDLPIFGGDLLSLDIHAGEIIFALGANGSGKSALIQHINQSNSRDSIRISAHRQTWLPSSTVDLTAKGMRQWESEIRNQDARPESRWQGTYGEQKPGIALFKLINSDIPELREIRKAGRARDDSRVHELSDKPSPLEQINRLLHSSNFPVTISIEDEDEVWARRDEGQPYSMAEMSDGERSAILIATDVLTAEPGTLFLIDEPERHLHRSIIVPLLSSLISTRGDCAFVIATHEVGLPLDFPESRVLLVRECHFADGSAMTWTADLLEPPHPIDKQLQRDILGSRRKILFVEGRANASLDHPLYGLLFPNVSIVSKGGQGDVIRSVKGLRGASDLTWIEAFGIVDRDNRSEEEVATLRDEGIFALDWYSVESIYYHPELQLGVAKRLAESAGGDPVADLAKARGGAINRIRQQADHIIDKRTMEAARQQAQEGIPTKLDLTQPLQVPQIDVPALRSQERAKLTRAIEGNDLDMIVESYPIRETGALDAIAKGLRFQSEGDYEQAVLTLLRDDQESLEWVRSQFAPLLCAIEDAGA